jgi:parallel beta-helix repeat protein
MSLGINTRITDAREQPSTFSRGKTLYVGGTGEGNYTKIQDAIDNASYMNTVFVFDDSSPYYENVVVNKSIFLIGEDRNTTIIDGEGYLIVVSLAEMAFVEGVLVSGFTIQNGRTGIYYDTGINNIDRHSLLLNYEHTASAGLRNNVLINNEIGIRVGWLSSDVYISRNKITLNEKGIILDTNSFDNVILKNTILGNDCGICLYDCYSNDIHDNIIRSNNNLGIYLRNSRSNIISGNKIIDNDYGIWHDDSSGTFIWDNTISNNNDFGIGFIESSGNTITCNTISSNIKDGIHFYNSDSNEIAGNNISLNNNDGIRLYNSVGNTILYNNFIDNKRDAFFNNNVENIWKRNTWKQNYWNRPRILPKLIFGEIEIIEGFIFMPWFNIDWRPALRPI